MTRLTEVIAGGRVTPDTVAGVREALLFDRGSVIDKYSRFFLLSVLSAVIATGGIVADSTAIVVGAMIIAPLMTPMLATALSTITGDGRNALRSLLITFGGAALVVLVAALVTWLAPTGVHLAGNHEVAARTAPRLIDLVIALAAGAAGALAAGRKDIGEVLPGVAIAISIVPPLCVAGAALAEGSPELAYGALLLFTTNFFAIQMAGCAVFASMGFHKVALSGADSRARHTGLAVALVGTLILTVPLAATSGRLAQDAALERQVTVAVSSWLRDTGFESISVAVKDSTVTVQITGQGEPPLTSVLAGLLSSSNPRPSTVRVLILPQELTLPTAGNPAAPSVPSTEVTVTAPGQQTATSRSVTSSQSTDASTTVLP